MAASIMGQSERCAVYQIVRADMNYVHNATQIFDGDIKGFAAGLGEQEFRYIYRVGPGRETKGNKLVFPDFEWYIRACFERQRMTMIVDEAHFLCSPRYCPVFFWESVITGRHAYLDIVYVTQRFSMVHHDITANTHEFYFWKITEPADLAGIRERCGEDAMQSVANLRKTEDNRRTGGELVPGDFMHWTA